MLGNLYAHYWAKSSLLSTQRTILVLLSLTLHCMERCSCIRFWKVVWKKEADRRFTQQDRRGLPGSFLEHAVSNVLLFLVVLVESAARLLDL